MHVSEASKKHFDLCGNPVLDSPPLKNENQRAAVTIFVFPFGPAELLKLAMRMLSPIPLATLSG
jgi:hypothetical protein